MHKTRNLAGVNSNWLNSTTLSEVGHAHSYQTPAAQGSCAAPPAASGRASQTPREPHGELGRASGGVVPRPTSSLHVTALTYMWAVLEHHRVNFAD